MSLINSAYMVGPLDERDTEPGAVSNRKIYGDP